MSSYLREIKSARIDPTTLTVDFSDGAILSVPLGLYPTLLLASDDERDAMEVSPYSLHWESLDCDLGVEGLLQGAHEHPKLAEQARKRSQLKPLNVDEPKLSLIQNLRTMPDIEDSFLERPKAKQR